MLLPPSSFAPIFAKCRSRSGFLSNVAFAGFCLFSLPFFAFNLVKFFCSRLFAKCFDLRSWLSVSSPHRSVGTLSLLPRGSFVYQTRRKPCTLSISLGIVAQLSDKWKPEYRHLGIFILYSRDLSLQPPFAEVLSGLLRAAYWPLVFLFSSFSGLFWPGSFFPSFRIWIPKRCKGVHCVDLGESFPTRIYLQKSASIQPRTSPSKFEGKIQFNIHFTP